MNRRKFLGTVATIIGPIVIAPLLTIQPPKGKEKFVVKSARDLPIFSYSSKDRKCHLECQDGYFHTKTLEEVKYINKDIYDYITHLESCGIPIG